MSRLINCVPLDEMAASGMNIFGEKFSGSPSVMGIAPGRVNLIGEHTDYNEGFVLPMALHLYTLLVGRARTDRKVRIYSNSESLKEGERWAEFDLASPIRPSTPEWANYVKGVVSHCKEKLGDMAHGFEGVFLTSVPLGGGLSSSAALEVATISFMSGIIPELDELSVVEKALICQKAEHTFANMPCGIMDQFISLMGKSENALLLDCRSLEAKLVPLIDESVVVLVTNSHVRHSLTGSEYPTRRKTCQRVADILRKKSLRDATLEEIEKVRDQLDEEMFRFARHVISEIKRTEQAAGALEANDYATFGRLMLESHQSLRDDYQVSCPELDLLVELAVGESGVFGSRMTGGGFGGCTVTLLTAESVPRVMERMRGEYTHAVPSFYVCPPADGAKFIRL